MAFKVVGNLIFTRKMSEWTVINGSPHIHWLLLLFYITDDDGASALPRSHLHRDLDGQLNSV